MDPAVAELGTVGPATGHPVPGQVQDLGLTTSFIWSSLTILIIFSEPFWDIDGPKTVPKYNLTQFSLHYHRTYDSCKSNWVSKLAFFRLSSFSNEARYDSVVFKSLCPRLSEIYAMLAPLRFSTVAKLCLAV